MTREIKFRGKDILTDKWVYGDLLHLGNAYAIVTSYEEEELEVNPISDRLEIRVEDIAGVYPDTVGQFTGITDKNGTEIYEGDIIGCHYPDIKHLIFYNEKLGRFMAALNGDIDNDFVSICGLGDSRWNASKEVIGNIHDNPELLNEE